MFDGTIALIVFFAAALFGGAAALIDLKTMTIPNWLTGSTALVFAILMLIGLGLEEGLWRVGNGLVVLFVGALLFWAGAIGGGDAKAAAAFAIPIAPIDASFVFLALAINGLVALGVIALLRRTALASGSWSVWSSGRSFPYGLPLAMTLILYTGLVAFLLN